MPSKLTGKPVKLGTTEAGTSDVRASFAKNTPEINPSLTNASFDYAKTSYVPRGSVDSSTDEVVGAVLAGAKIAKNTYVGIKANQIQHSTNQLAEAIQASRVGELSPAEEQQLMNTQHIFKRYGLARKQGAMTDTAAMIAVESEIKRVASQYPMLADDIKQAAVQELGFDPTGSRYDFLFSGPTDAGGNTPEDYYTKLHNELWAQSKIRAEVLGVPTQIIYDRMVRHTIAKEQANALSNQISLAGPKRSSIINQAQIDYSTSVVDIVHEDLLTITNEGDPSINYLSDAELKSEKMMVRKRAGDIRDRLRMQLDASNASDTVIRSTMDQFNSRVQTTLDTIDSYSKASMVELTAKQAEYKKTLLALGTFPYAMLGQEIGVEKPYYWAMAMSNPDSALNQNLTDLLPSYGIPADAIGTGDSTRDVLRNIMLGDYTSISRRLGEEGSTEVAKNVVGSAVHSNEASPEPAIAAHNWVQEHSTGDFFMEDFAAHPAKYANNPSAIGILKDSVSPMSAYAAAQRFNEAIDSSYVGKLTLKVEDGKIVLDTSKLPEDATFGFFNTWNRTEALQDMQTVVSILNNKELASKVGTTPAEYVSAINKYLTGGEAPSSTEDADSADTVSREYVAGIANDMDVPEQLAVSLVNAESNFNPNAVSPDGAVGLGQLMPDTARVDLNMTVSDELDERLDPEKNLRASFTYLKRLLDRYNGDQVLALMAYNSGLGDVDQLLQGARSVRDIPEETKNYVAKILGINDLAAYLQRNGYLTTF